jgi:hypothetical protein
MPYPAPNYSSPPQVFSGPRALFSIENQPIAYAGNVNGEETVDYEPVNVLDLIEIAEHVPVAYRCSLSAQVFRVIGSSIKKLGIFPKFRDIITSNAMRATMTDSKPVDGESRAFATFTGVRCAGHTWDTTARGLTADNVTFVAIKVADEDGQ